MKTTGADLPFFRPVAVSQIRKSRMIKLTASQDERRAVALHLGLEAIDVLEAAINIRPWRRHGLGIEGGLTATVGQNCTITAEPMKTEISETFDERFYPADRDKRQRQSETVIDVEATDDYEIFTDDTVDLGVLVVEYLSLAIDPYPKRPGAILPDGEPDARALATDQPRRVSPFAGLADRLSAGAGDGDTKPGASRRRKATGAK